MKGLLLDNFYKTIDSMKLFACIVLALGIALLITGNDTVLELFVLISITALSLNGVSGMRKDTEAKWNKFELTLPIKRTEIVKSKYLSFLFWVFVGTIIALLITGLACLIHGNLFLMLGDEGAQNAVSMFALGIGIAILAGSLFYPLAYLFGSDKSETILVVSVIGGVAIAALLIWVINFYLEALVKKYYYASISIFVLAYAVLFFISYFITKQVYKVREF